MRKPRQLAESGIYHVIVRGAGRQVIFEDDNDRHRYLADLEKYTKLKKVGIIAWCLMSNHVHLLLEGEMPSIASLMQLFNSEYAQYFNLRHDKVGPLFQGRYKSEPVETDEYLLTVIRYIHENPSRAGISNVGDYRWSSYSEYAGEPQVCDTETAMRVFGTKREFIDFHESASGNTGFALMDYRSARRLGDDELIECAIDLLGEDKFRRIKELPRENKARAINSLRDCGMSIRQVERITGIGRNVISRSRHITK